MKIVTIYLVVLLALSLQGIDASMTIDIHLSRTQNRQIKFHYSCVCKNGNKPIAKLN
jgi:CDP-diacylglycerol pyrophosphatase